MPDDELTAAADADGSLARALRGARTLVEAREIAQDDHGSRPGLAAARGSADARALRRAARGRRRRSTRPGRARSCASSRPSAATSVRCGWRSRAPSAGPSCGRSSLRFRPTRRSARAASGVWLKPGTWRVPARRCGAWLQPGTCAAHAPSTIAAMRLLRHVDAARSSSFRRRPGRSECTSAGRPSTSGPHRQRRPVRRARVARAMARADGLRDQARPQHHRHQRQDLRRGAGAERASSRPKRRAGTSRTRPASGSGCPTRSRPRPRRCPSRSALIEELDRAGLRVRGRRRRLLPRRALPGLRRAVAASGPTRCESRSRTRARRTRATSRSGRRTSRARTPGGSRPGAGAGPGGTSSAPRWPEKQLGPEFEIHGGGLDLVFPHHENEIAPVACARAPVRADLDAQRDAPLHRRGDAQVARATTSTIRGGARPVGARDGCSSSS